MSSSSSAASSLDCGRLLQFAANTESDYAKYVAEGGESAEATNSTITADTAANATLFGHPDPPQLTVTSIEAENENEEDEQKDESSPLQQAAPELLAVAYTKHTISGQLFLPLSAAALARQSDPVEICLLLPEDDTTAASTSCEDEYITCLTTVALKEEQQQDEDSSVAFSSDESGPTSIKKASSMLTGTVEADDDTSDQRITKDGGRRLAVVFGTNCSRLYVVELRATAADGGLEVVKMKNGSALFQVFSMDEDPRQQRRSSWTGSSSLSDDTLFRPTGGVQSLHWYQEIRDACAAVWITYGDGTLIRVPNDAFVPSLWQTAAGQNCSVEDLVGASLVRCQLELPPLGTNMSYDNNTSAARQQGTIMTVPLPRHHPSPVSALTTVLQQRQDHHDDASSEEDDEDDEREREVFDALVFGQTATHVVPTLLFYTSEGEGTTGVSDPGDESSKLPESSLSSSSSSGRRLKSVTKSLMGSAFGALRRGLIGVTAPDEENRNPAEEGDGEDRRGDYEADPEPTASPFPSLRQPPVHLFCASEFHDAPRKVEVCSIDPNGKLAALADGLGRVLLVDLSTKQVIRMWKGFREASCYWLQSIDNAMHLVIHSKPRRVVEVWKVRHGPRVASIPVSRDAKVIPTIVSGMASCYLVQSTIPGSPNQCLELIRLDEATTSTNDSMILGASPRISVSTSSPTAAALSTPSRKAALRLQHLQQLLATGAADRIQYTKDDVRKALHEIKSLADLSTALDLLATGSVLEEKLGVKGSAFHRDALKYCQGHLNASSQRKSPRANPHVQMLSHKIDYHTQLVKAYDVLFKFESTEHAASQEPAKTQSHWAAEAMAWASTYEQVTGASLDAELSSKPKTRIPFSKFAASCTFPHASDSRGKTKVYFSESSRTRRDVLCHVFRPLLADVFSFNAVYSIFDNLGTRSDSEYVEQCFGEWFMTLALNEVCSKGLFCENPPMVRLLQNLVFRQLSNETVDEGCISLRVLFKFCEGSSDLVRAFMLGTMCLEAVKRATAQKEKWSYGKVQSGKMMDDWQALLRRIRVCLLVSLRMYGARLAAPMTVNNVNQPDIFSIYEWLARDELSMSHHHEEIVSLEKACSMSSHAFDPSRPEGDGPAKFKQLQNSCLSSVVTELERSEFMVEFGDDDRFGALLLFLKSHNDSKYLAVHRSLLLAAEWSTAPKNLDYLKDAIVALKSLQLEQDTEKLTAAVSLDIWQSRLCPVFRAHLFGFDTVHEVSEDVISPLLQDRDWLTIVGRIGLQLLAILKDSSFENKDAEMKDASAADDPQDKDECWPPLRPDCVVQRLQGKLVQPVDGSALHAHSVVLCALLVSGDIKTLVKCVPAIYDLFAPASLFQPVMNTTDGPGLQQGYLHDAIFKLAAEYSGAQMERFDLGEIDTLSSVWNFEKKDINTIFLLAMYEAGKDRIVDELLTKASSQIDAFRFVNGGVDIACRRLDSLLSGKRMHSSGMRDVMSLLDASLCEWIKQRSSVATSLLERPKLDVSIASTHLLVMRLLSISSSAIIDSNLRVKIHSMVVMTGILEKALGDLEEKK